MAASLPEQRLVSEGKLLAPRRITGRGHAAGGGVGPARLAIRLAVAVALVLGAPAGAQGLEPRFDHRDQQGFLTAVETWRETVAIRGRPTIESVQPRLRLAWTRDVSGEGGELILGAAVRLDGWRDEGHARYLTGVDGRYRGYFGTEELKTFFEVGLWAELKNRLAAGPQVALGLAYDPSRAWGGFLSLGFATAFGAARIASVGISAGVQLRFE